MKFRTVSQHGKDLMHSASPELFFSLPLISKLETFKLKCSTPFKNKAFLFVAYK